MQNSDQRAPAASDDPRAAAPTAAAVKPLVVAVVTADAAFHAAVFAAVADIAAGGVVAAGELARPAVAPEPHEAYAGALAKARRYLEKSRQSLAVTVVQATSLARAAEKLAALPDAGPLGMLFVDAASTGLDADAQSLDDHLEAFYSGLAAASIPSLRSPYAVVVHRAIAPWSGGAYVMPDRYLLRLLQPERPWLLRTEQLCLLVDFLELTFENRRNHKAAVRDSEATLGDELVRFLCNRAGADWLFFYYTSSGVSPLIDHTERAAHRRGVLALRAANEHALACGAMANHLLHGRPFLLMLGLSMMDEMRGTLANLRSSGAKGFIVAPEIEPGHRFGFQATISGDEDMRAVLAARRIPHVYIEGPDTMLDRLEEAFRLYEEGRGPVVLLTAQAALDAREPLARSPNYPAKQADYAQVPLSAENEAALSAAVAILNGERSRVLFQCGRLDPEEEALVHAIAERAGVALVDTLGHPGTVSAFRSGARVPHYLGTLGLYGFKQRSHAFLHPEGKLAPRAEHCLFLIKSKAGQRAAFFTPFRRAGLRFVQVTRRADHVAPDAEIALVMDAKTFLRRVLARLDVAPEVRSFRAAAIEATAAAGADVTSTLPSLPMSPNHFFRELGALVERMIEVDGYAYTGVYDVGRCSVSAVRSVPRTGPGYSGWYGRALMGDAPASMATLPITEPGNVVAFVGDGAKGLVADPVPALLENALAHHPSRVDKNITLFYLSNGTFSGIRSYRERLSSKWGGRQMRALGLIEPDAEHDAGPLRLVRRTLATFDGAFLRDALLARRRLNVFTVLLGHNNEDDGFSLVSGGWQRDARRGSEG